ncbi:MAG: sucB [Chlamydiales bacterium]|jgi:2-oxoglutarate dehydrogenase E2 component (dihydrolipoamide succinyltransferase)|nr:sucB [Chlamydiales bacterium]
MTMRMQIKVPQLGESIKTACIGSIIVPAGSLVSMDQEILELDTDKANQVVYAPWAGVIDWAVKEGDIVFTGQVIGHIEELKSKSKKTKEQKQIIEASTLKLQPAEFATKLPSKSVLDRDFANLEIGAVEFKPKSLDEDSKQRNKIMNQEQKMESATGSQTSKEIRKKMSPLRKVIAQKLVEAQLSMAVLTTFNEVDMSAIMALRTQYQEAFLKKYNVKLGLMSFFIKAVVAGLKEFPVLNAMIDEQDIVYRNYYDIGVAISSDKGLVVPIMRQCDNLSLSEMEKQIDDFTKKSKENSLSIDELQGGTFTITNGGVFGSMLSTPLLTPPQSAILGMHKIEKRPIVIDDQIVIRPMMYVALSYDHRLIDGREAVSFLVHVKNILEDPQRLLLDV